MKKKTILQFIGSLLFVCLLLALFYYFYISKKLIDGLFLFLGVGDNSSLSLLYLSGLAIIIILLNLKTYKIENLKHFGFLKNLNWWLYLAIIFLILSWTFSIALLYGLAWKPYSIKQDINIEYGNKKIPIGYIFCNSKRFMTAVKRDILDCYTKFEIPSEFYTNGTNIELIHVRNGEVSKAVNIYTGFVNSSRFEYSFNIYLMDNEYYDINLEVQFSKKLKANAFFSELVEDRYYVTEQQDQRRITMFTILAASFSVSIFAIFGGISSLKQLADPQKRPKRRRKRKAKKPEISQ